MKKQIGVRQHNKGPYGKLVDIMLHRDALCPFFKLRMKSPTACFGAQAAGWLSSLVGQAHMFHKGQTRL